MLKDEEFEDLVESLMPAVDQQLNSPETKYVEKTYQHLLEHKDIDDNEARYLIACCLAICSDKMLRTGKPFDHKGYQSLLKKLPQLPD